MNLTDFWLKLTDMTTSDKPLFVVGERSITERQFIWILGLFGAILLLIAIRNIALWIVNGTVKKVVNAAVSSQAVAEVVAPKQEAPLDAKSAPLQEEKNTQLPTNDEHFGKQSPKELLENTSEKRRTLYDFVTPDTIHADVMKQTLNNDYPYQTLKPDPSKIFVPKEIPVQPAPEKTLSTIEFSQVPKQPVAQTHPMQMPTQPEPILRAAPTGSINPIFAPPASPPTVPQAKPLGPEFQGIQPPEQAPVTTPPAIVQPVPQPITPLPQVQPQVAVPPTNAPIPPTTPPAAPLPATPVVQQQPLPNPITSLQPEVAVPVIAPVTQQTVAVETQKEPNTQTVSVQPPVTATEQPPRTPPETIKPAVDLIEMLSEIPGTPRKPIEAPPMPNSSLPTVEPAREPLKVQPTEIPITKTVSQPAPTHPFNPADSLLP